MSFLVLKTKKVIYLFLHLFVPLFSIITFLFFDNIKLKFKDTFYGLLPVAIYGLGYVSNVLVHVEDGKISQKYDFYYFAQGNAWSLLLIIPLFFVFTYCISFLLYRITCKLSGEEE